MNVDSVAATYHRTGPMNIVKIVDDDGNPAYWFLVDDDGRIHLAYDGDDNPRPELEEVRPP